MPSIDIHCHPGLKNYMFGKHIYQNFPAYSSGIPWGQYVDLHKMKAGEVRAAVAVHYLPEIELYKNSGAKFLKALLRSLLPKLEDRSLPTRPFEQLKFMIAQFEEDVRQAATHGFPDAVVAHTFTEFKAYWQQ